jgi:antitoxin ParD1/3/4
MSITLTAEQESIVADLIATGSFQTANEVLQAALTLLETDRESYQAWLTQTRELVREGIESLDSAEPTLRERGEGVDGETVVNDLLAKLHRAKEARV